MLTLLLQPHNSSLGQFVVGTFSAITKGNTFFLFDDDDDDLERLPGCTGTCLREVLQHIQKEGMTLRNVNITFNQQVRSRRPPPPMNRTA